jgi:hypothetical protein
MISRAEAIEIFFNLGIVYHIKDERVYSSRIESITTEHRFKKPSHKGSPFVLNKTEDTSEFGLVITGLYGPTWFSFKALYSTEYKALQEIIRVKEEELNKIRFNAEGIAKNAR